MLVSGKTAWDFVSANVSTSFSTSKRPEMTRRANRPSCTQTKMMYASVISTIYLHTIAKHFFEMESIADKRLCVTKMHGPVRTAANR